MDYNFRGHPRIILSKTLIGASKKVRLYATNYVRQLLRAEVNEFSDWGIRFLYTQTYDPVVEICEKAIVVLEEACSKKENLVELVKLRPSFDHLLELGTPLLVKLLSFPEGFKYLQDGGFVEKVRHDFIFFQFFFVCIYFFQNYFPSGNELVALRRQRVLRSAA